MLSQWCFNVGQPFATLDNIKSTLAEDLALTDARYDMVTDLFCKLHYGGRGSLIKLSFCVGFLLFKCVNNVIVGIALPLKQSINLQGSNLLSYLI